MRFAKTFENCWRVQHGRKTSATFSWNTFCFRLENLYVPRTCAGLHKKYNFFNPDIQFLVLALQNIGGFVKIFAVDYCVNTYQTKDQCWFRSQLYQFSNLCGAIPYIVVGVRSKYLTTFHRTFQRFRMTRKQQQNSLWSNGEQWLIGRQHFFNRSLQSANSSLLCFCMWPYNKFWKFALFKSRFFRQKQIKRTTALLSSSHVANLKGLTQSSKRLTTGC